MDKTYEHSFDNECSVLATLETFDPAVFLGDGRVPQSLCDFVLALALIFNDLRDLSYANVLVRDYRPTGRVKTLANGATIPALTCTYSV